MEITQDQIKEFLAILTYKANCSYAYDANKNKTYTRIAMAPVHNCKPLESQRSVYCFIRNSDGAILKAASYKAPAKGVRAWLGEVLIDSSRVSPTTAWLYR